MLLMVYYEMVSSNQSPRVANFILLVKKTGTMRALEGLKI